MSQSSERSRYRQFVFASAERRPSPLGDTIAIVSARLGRSYRLDPTEFEIARLFDGTRDAAAIRAAAAELGHDLAPAQLESFAADLAQADLLLAGREDPLPVPAQTDEEARQIGWSAERPDPESKVINSNAVPPSTAPGSRTAPALGGTLTNRVSTSKGAKTEVATALPLTPFLPLGWLAAIPVVFLPVLAVLLLATIFVIYKVSISDAPVLADLSRIHGFLPLAATLLAGLWITNFVSQLARAAVIRRYTGELPRFGLTYWLQFFPWFSTSTAGVPERADLSTRLRIIGAAPAATLGMAFLFLCAYFAFFRSGLILASIVLWMSLAAAFLLLLAANPFLKRDGYSLVATWVKAPDLREQAFMALFGISRPWQRGPTLSMSQMSAYIVLCFLWMALIIYLIIRGPGTWLQAGWGVTGVIVGLSLLALFMYDIYRRMATRRGTVGNIKLTMPSVWLWIVVFVLGTFSLVPYHYEASGQFQILPTQQVEVHALTAGDIRQVLVKEGDYVKAGQLLVKINDDAQVAQVAATEADIDSLQHQLALQLAGTKPEQIEEARQEVATAQKKYDFSYAESNRIEAAFRRNAASAQERDRAVGQAAVDREALQTAKANLAVVASPVRNDQIMSMQAQIAHDQAELVYDKQELAYTEIRAPIAGRVVSQTLLNAVGHYLNRGDIVAAIQDDKLYAQVYMPEVEMGDLKLGAHVRAKAFAYPGTEFYGAVTAIAPAAQANASSGTSNPNSLQQSATGYNVVRVLCTIDDPHHQLKPDMTGMAKVAGRTYPAAQAFLRPIVRGLMVEVWSWLP